MTHSSVAEHRSLVGPTDRRDAKVLCVEECRQRLVRLSSVAWGSSATGRSPSCRSTTSSTARTSPSAPARGAQLQTAVEGGRVAFEVDGYDADASSRWSVLVHGNATVVYEAETGCAWMDWRPARGTS